jgi:pSer/pThr/pTyr-binding forkhead associated (FHA) protein
MSMPERAHGPDSGAYAANITFLLSLKGQHLGTFRFDRGPIVVGREPQADIFVDNPGVSRQHFRVERTDAGEFRVVDLGSSNGTYLNDKPIQTATLRDGDVIQFAKYSLQTQIEELVGGSGSRRSEGAAPENATVMLTPSDVRRMMADTKDGKDGSRDVPALKVVPGRSVSTPSPSPATAPASEGSRAWIAWVVGAVAILAAAGAWLYLR